MADIPINYYSWSVAGSAICTLSKTLGRDNSSLAMRRKVVRCSALVDSNLPCSCMVCTALSKSFLRDFLSKKTGLQATFFQTIDRGVQEIFGKCGLLVRPDGCTFQAMGKYALNYCCVLLFVAPYQVLGIFMEIVFEGTYTTCRFVVRDSVWNSKESLCDTSKSGLADEEKTTKTRIGLVALFHAKAGDHQGSLCCRWYCRQQGYCCCRCCSCWPKAESPWKMMD